MQSIGERFKLIRKKHNLTQQAFADSLSVKRAHISNIENGNDMPSKPLIRLASIIYGETEAWIKDGRSV